MSSRDSHRLLRLYFWSSIWSATPGFPTLIYSCIYFFRPVSFTLIAVVLNSRSFLGVVVQAQRDRGHMNGQLRGRVAWQKLRLSREYRLC